MYQHLQRYALLLVVAAIMEQSSINSIRLTTYQIVTKLAYKCYNQQGSPYSVGISFCLI